MPVKPRIPDFLATAVTEDAEHHPERRHWLEALPETIERLAGAWELELEEPYEPGGTAAWVAPVRRVDGQELVLKVGWRHFEAEHEAEALQLWEGDGAVRCLEASCSSDTIALLLERCEPGIPLGRRLAETEQDPVIAGLLRRLWRQAPVGPFRSLEALCEYWAGWLEADLEAVAGGVDLALVAEALVLLRELPASSDQRVLLCTDLHAENVLAAEREPWLAVDPKPFVGDPAFDPVQHMLNCERLRTDPAKLAARLAELLDLDPYRVRLWLFTRCAQESLREPSLEETARRLAP